MEQIKEKAAAQYGMLISADVCVSSVHLPFGADWDISATDEPRRAHVLQNTQALLDWVGVQGIGIAVLHPSAEPIADDVRAARLARATEAIAQLGAYARDRNVALAVENLPRTCLGNCAREMLLLSDNGKSAAMCFDVNHLLIESHRAYYSQVAPYVITTHLSDYDRIDERHWFPGDGCIDWAELYGLFEAYGYGGRFMFEIGERSSPALGRAFSPSELAQRFWKLTGGA